MRIKFRALDGRCASLKVSRSADLTEVSASVRHDLKIDADIKMVSRGRIVQSVSDFIGSEVVTVVKSARKMDDSPNVHEIFAVMNGGDFGVIIDASCGVVRVTDDFMYRIRPVIHNRRAFLVLSVDMLAGKVAVLLRSASDFVQPDAFNPFSVAASRIATHYDSMRVLPVVVSCVRPMHTGVFVQFLPWARDVNKCCECCGADVCAYA